MKSLDQKDFKMNVVKDLGMINVGQRGQKQRFGIFECPICLKHFKRNIQIAKKTSMCKTCRFKIDNPNYRHGACKKESDNKNYSRWANMLTRCNNKNSKDYHNYGGRGIKVNFKNFSEYNTYISLLKNANRDGYTVDRINFDGDYEKGNLRWATHSEQCANQRTRKSKTGVTGVTVTRYGTYLARVTVARRKRIELGTYKTIEDAKRAIVQHKVASFKHTSSLSATPTNKVTENLYCNKEHKDLTRLF